MEEWKDIKNFEGLYQVSNLGRVRNTKTNRIMKQSITNQGYCLVGLRKNNKYWYKLVHRLVAEKFLGNFDKLPIVNHIDGNKLNNYLDNLEWCSYSHNEKHAYEIGIKKAYSKPIIQYDLEGNYIKEWASIQDAGRELKLNIGNISNCCHKRKHHSRVGKYKFAFKVELEEV